MLRRRRPCPECGHKVKESYCDVCGYDVVSRTRATSPPRPGV